MKTFSLHLQDAAHSERIDAVASFVAEDASGSFGLLAGHHRFVTTLGLGLARFRTAGGAWQYVAVPGAVLYFLENKLYLSARRFLRDSSHARISAALHEELAAEEASLKAIKHSLRMLEQEMLKHLFEIGQSTRLP